MIRAVKRPGDMFDTSTNTRTKRGDCGGPDVVYCTSDHWVAGSNPCPPGLFYIRQRSWANVMYSPLFVCLSVCLSVCLLAGLLKKLWTDLNEI